MFKKNRTKLEKLDHLKRQSSFDLSGVEGDVNQQNQNKTNKNEPSVASEVAEATTTGRFFVDKPSKGIVATLKRPLSSLFGKASSNKSTTAIETAIKRRSRSSSLSNFSRRLFNTGHQNSGDDNSSVKELQHSDTDNGVSLSTEVTKLKSNDCWIDEVVDSRADECLIQLDRSSSIVTQYAVDNVSPINDDDNTNGAENESLPDDVLQKIFNEDIDISLSQPPDVTRSLDSLTKRDDKDLLSHPIFQMDKPINFQLLTKYISHLDALRDDPVVWTLDSLLTSVGEIFRRDADEKNDEEPE